MKKFLAILLIVVFTMTCLTACSYSSENETSSSSTISESPTEQPISNSFEAKELVGQYCNGSWDGSFISNNEHCASIIDGELWIDCKIVESIPDMGPYEDCFWAEVVGSNELGTWIYDKQLGTIELWKKGVRYQKIVTGFEKKFVTKIYFLDNCIVARNSSNISIYALDGYNITNIRDVIDCYQTDGEVLYSNFEHKNFSIDGLGTVEEIESNYVRFPRKNVQLKEDMSNLVTFPFNQYWEGNWKLAEFYPVTNTSFYFIDYYGDIYVNNKLTGNINVSSIITEDGSNLLTKDDYALYLDGKELITYKKGEATHVDIPDGNAKFVWDDNRYGTVILVYGSKADDNTLVIVKGDKLKVISENVSDVNVAYDTIYYMEGDKVYSLEWQEADAMPILFVEGAFAVSQRTDELEGAIVPSDKNNMEEYGESNLYSPYGIDK